MIAKRLEEAINAQINAELWSAYLYLSMSTYCQDAGYPGVANWFAIQFKEEQDHAMIFFNYFKNITLTKNISAIFKCLVALG